MAEPQDVTVTLQGPGLPATELTVSAGASALTGEVLAELLRSASATADRARVLVDGRPVSDSSPWYACGVRHGSVVSVGVPPDRVEPGEHELRVVAGPCAGVSCTLGAAAVVLGRDDGCDLVIDDREVSRRHAEVSVEADGSCAVRDLGSTNGLAVEGGVVEGSAPLPVGSLLSIGESQVRVVARRDDRAALDRGAGPAMRFNRPPRPVRPTTDPAELRRPGPPSPPERGRIPVAALVVPLALGGLLFVTMPSSPQYLLLLAMSPLMLVANLVTDGRGGRRRHRSALRAHLLAVAGFEAELSAACADDERRRHDAAPDAAELLARAILPSTRLWERRRDDPDALVLRIGVADQPAAVTVIDDALPESPPTARSVPVTVPMDQVGVLGIVGERAQTVALARWLVGQSAVLVAPYDVSIVVLTSPGRVARWEWLRWLPHAHGQDTCQVLVGTDETSCAQRVAELTRLVERRRDGRPRAGTAYGRVLLVVDGARGLRQVPGLAALLGSGPEVGVLSLCLDSEERLLPQECTAVAAFEPGSGTRLRLRRPDGTVTSDILADQVSRSWADQVSRALAGLQGRPESTGTTTETGSPRLLDLLDLPGSSAEAVTARWRAGGPAMAALIGVGDDGPVVVDLCADGPHALIAGTTGSGKSELLQTMVASLAVANPPDALTFVLVDYKGGAAFRDCARLPHTVGLVTDLDGPLTERALASLTAELRHRERVLAEHGAKDIEALLRQCSGDAAPPLARLVILIDEFATLVEELPEFIRGLVGIAQRGRSLGLHLVLATQRPGGVVSPDIRANTNLRICLRVTQPAESSDVVDSPQASEIPSTQPGRAFLRSGSGSLRGFQAARVGGLTPVAEPGVRPYVTAVAFVDLALPDQRSALAAAGDRPDTERATDLSLLVDAVLAAHVTLGSPTPRRPWLDPLPARLTLAELPRATDAEPDLQLGLLDLPGRQEQLPYRLRLATSGHLLVAGAPRSGRSSVLQTLAGGVAARWSADDLHLYALDFGSHALAPLAGLPHCGAVVGRDQPERLERLLLRLTTEVEARQVALAAEGYADLTEQRRLAAPAERLPWLLLLVDRWEGLLQTYQDVDMGRRIDELLRLLRDGPAVGLRAVVTADRSGLLGRLPSVIPDKLILRLADRADYALADIPIGRAPTAPPPGRGLVVGDGDRRALHEVQIALLADDPDGPAQLAALRAAVHESQLRHADVPLLHRPLRVDPLPSAVTVDHALSLGPTAAEAIGRWALIGVGGDQLRPVGVDLDDIGPGFLVAGAARSGRSTALLTMAESLLRGGRPVCLVAAGRSPLATLAAHPGVTALLDGNASESEWRRALTTSGPPPVVVVDDAEQLTDTAVGRALERELRAAPGQGALVVAAGNNEDLQATYRGFTVDLRRSRCGLLLNPRSSLDGDLVGVRLPRHPHGSAHPGRALLAVRGELLPVQVARS